MVNHGAPRCDDPSPAGRARQGMHGAAPTQKKQPCAALSEPPEVSHILL